MRTIQGPQREAILDQRGPLDGVVEIMALNAQMPGVIQLDATLSTEALDADHPAHEFFATRIREFRADALRASHKSANAAASPPSLTSRPPPS